MGKLLKLNAALFTAHKPMILVALVLTAAIIGAVFVASPPQTTPLDTGTPTDQPNGASVQTDAQGREICTSDQPPGAQDGTWFDAEIVKTYGNPVSEYDLKLTSKHDKELNISVTTAVTDGPPIAKVCHTQEDITPLSPYTSEIRHLDFGFCSNTTGLTQVKLIVVALEENDWNSNWKCEVLGLNL